MKTTIDLPADLLERAKAVASEEGISLKQLVEQGLRLAIRERRRRGPFKLRDAAVSGRGLQAGLVEGSWEQIRAAIYEGRGG